MQPHQSAMSHIQLGKTSVNTNQSACCGGGAIENSEAEEAKQNSSSNQPLQKEQKDLKGTGTRHELKLAEMSRKVNTGIEDRAKKRKEKEEDEARRVRLTSGALAKSLLDDSKAEPLPRIRRPGEPTNKTWLPPPPAPKKAPLPPRGPKYNEQLEDHLNHLPFYKHDRYNRNGILMKIKKIRPLRGILFKGRYFIDKDRPEHYDPRMDPDALVKLLRRFEMLRSKYRAEGRVTRIVELFLDKVMGWDSSRDILMRNSKAQGRQYCFMWLGPNLAMKMLTQFANEHEEPMLFETIKRVPEDKEFYIVNRLPIDVVFKDKEAFYSMLSRYILHPKLECKMRPADESLHFANLKSDCSVLDEKGLVTRRVCVHHNLSMSLKPCAVQSCPNYDKPVCSHLYAFIPETITLNSYTSMLHFSERFKRVEDLRGAIFITKPAYLCNGRGIKFIMKLDQFEHFYHMLDGKATTRHGVLLQRYVECPRLFDNKKFTIRFFLLIIVLPKRRVLGFIHYGIALFSKLPYEPVEREDFTAEDEAMEGKEINTEVPVEERSIGGVTNESLQNEVHLSNYLPASLKASIREDIYLGRATMMDIDEDHAFYLEDILPRKCKNTTSIYIQMLFVSQCIMDYIQPFVRDYPGCFQTISIDSLVDARNKLWILEAGTNIFSGLLTIAPRQRQMMSAIIQETIGITLECFYKERNGLPMYWDYVNEKEDYDAIYFSQDFNLFYETEASKQTGYIFEKRPPPKPLLVEERYEVVDKQREMVAERKLFNLEKKKEMIEKRERYIAMVKAKDEEES